MKTLSDTCLRLALLLGPTALSVVICTCGPRQSAPPADAAYSYRLLPAAEATFGYEIRHRARPFIRQLTVPGRPGQRGFARPALARATAGLVIAKLRRGQQLPTITSQELDSLANRL